MLYLSDECTKIFTSLQTNPKKKRSELMTELVCKCVVYKPSWCTNICCVVSVGMMRLKQTLKVIQTVPHWTKLHFRFSKNDRLLFVLSSTFSSIFVKSYSSVFEKINLDDVPVMCNLNKLDSVFIRRDASITDMHADSAGH